MFGHICSMNNSNSASVLWNGLSSDLRRVAHHVTPSPLLNSPFSDLSASLFLKMLKPISFTVPFLHSLYSRIGYLRTDIYGINQASLFHLTLISLSFTVISFKPVFRLFDCKCL